MKKIAIGPILEDLNSKGFDYVVTKYADKQQHRGGNGLFGL